MKNTTLRLLLVGIITLCVNGYSLDNVYVGGQVGHVGLTDRTSRSFNNTIGFGLDLGFRPNALLDVMWSTQYSGHSGGIDGLTLWNLSLGSNFHLLEANDFDVSLGAGPGFYFFKYFLNSESHFGIHMGGACDVLATEHLKLGLGIRYYLVFHKDTDIGSNFWTIMMRVGYTFGS